MREQIPKSKLTHYVGSCVNQMRQSMSSAMPMARSLTFRASKYCYRRRSQAGRFEHVVGTMHNVSIKRFVSVRGPRRTPKGGDGKGRSETETTSRTRMWLCVRQSDGGRNSSGVMSGTKILDSKTIKNPYSR